MAALEALGAAPPASHRGLSVNRFGRSAPPVPPRGARPRRVAPSCREERHRGAAQCSEREGATISARNGRVSTSAASAEAGGCAAIGSTTAGLGSAGAAATAVSDSPSTTTGPMTRARPVRVIGHLHLLSHRNRPTARTTSIKSARRAAHGVVWNVARLAGGPGHRTARSAEEPARSPEAAAASRSSCPAPIRTRSRCCRARRLLPWTTRHMERPFTTRGKP